MIFMTITHNVAGVDVKVQRHGDTRLELISKLVGDLGNELNEPLTVQLGELKTRLALRPASALNVHDVRSAGYLWAKSHGFDVGLQPVSSINDLGDDVSMLGEGMYKVAGIGYIEFDRGRWVPKRDHEYFRNAHEMPWCSTLEDAVGQLRREDVRQ